MSFDADRLYALLPAIHRIRDVEQAGQLGLLLAPAHEAELQDLVASSAAVSAEQAARREALLEQRRRAGGPLRAPLSIVAEQAAVLEDNLDQLYDVLFIETCADWVVPYIGDLVGARGIFIFPRARFSQRAFVANTMTYRRRKGTAAVLEQLARDVTGWTASVVEYFRLLATTQYMNHVRLDNLAFADLRDARALERVGTPFDRVSRTAEVRRIEPGRGRYNIPNVGISLFRIDAFPATDAAAFRLDARRYLFDPLGRRVQLHDAPESELDITHLAEPINVPLPLARRELARDIATYYGVDQSLSLAFDGRVAAAGEITVCDLSDIGAGWAHMPSTTIAVDPVLGRIAFPSSQPPPSNVRVGYHYGFSAEMGGGEYAREATFVGTVPGVSVPGDRATIQGALEVVAAAGGVVEITRNDTFVETPIIRAGVAQGATIELRAAEERRPVMVLAGDLSIVGGEQSEVTLNGLLISGGRLRVPLTDATGRPNGLRLLRLRHCTLVPGPSPALGGVPAQPAGPRLFVELPNVRVEIDHSIVGAIRAIDGAEVHITHSILDATDEMKPAYTGLAEGEAGAVLTVENSTVRGTVHTQAMTLASNAIFLAGRPGPEGWPVPVEAERLQQGCVRFSFVPPGSRLPRPHRCQPAVAAEATRVRPTFTSWRLGDPGYGQLNLRCPVEIRRGADDGAEMGAFHDLHQPQREANLRASLEEYLRFGLEAGIFFAS
jgi:hypothetical protein